MVEPVHFAYLIHLVYINNLDHSVYFDDLVDLVTHFDIILLTDLVDLAALTDIRDRVNLVDLDNLAELDILVVNDDLDNLDDPLTTLPSLTLLISPITSTSATSTNSETPLGSLPLLFLYNPSTFPISSNLSTSPILSI